MERFIIGYSRHGKTLTSRPDLDDLVSYEEIFDAMAVLSWLAVRQGRRDRACPVAKELAIHAEDLTLTLRSAGQWDVQMKLVGAASIFELGAYAGSLVRPEFRE